MALSVKLKVPAPDDRPYTEADAAALVGKPFEFDGCPGTVREAFCMKGGDALHVTVEYERRHDTVTIHVTPSRWTGPADWGNR